MKSRSGALLHSVHQFARYAAEHASAGMDCALLLESGLGSTDDGISVEITDTIDPFFVRFMVCIQKSPLVLFCAVPDSSKPGTLQVTNTLTIRKYLSMRLFLDESFCVHDDRSCLPVLLHGVWT
jgi:hypothetical protein